MSFGAPRLTSSDIAPTTLTQFERQRTLNPEQESGIWAAFGAAVALPYVWQASESASVVAVVTSVLVVSALALALALTPSAVRYGVGTGVLGRAAFGPDAAIVFHLVRYGVVVLWSASLVGALAEWTALYVRAVVPSMAEVFELEFTASHELIRTIACICIGVLAGIVARGRVRRSRKVIRFVAFIASICVGCLLVLGVWRVKLGFDQVVGPPLQPKELVSVILAKLAPLPIIAMAAPEWVRYRGEHVKRGFFARLPRPLVNGLVVAFLATLVAVASRVVRHKVDGGLVGDATGAFGLGLGGVALALTFCLTFAVVPLFGILNASSALCTAIPKLRYPWVARITGLVVGVVAIAALADTKWLALAAPPVVILIVDEWIVRRNAVVLDALYEPGRAHIASLVACIAAWTVIVLFDEVGIACAIAAIGAALPLATRLGRSRRTTAAPANEPTPEADWTEQPKLSEAEWSPDEPTRKN